MEETRKSPIFEYEDRISDLPDVLILHILSFLDMRYVVQTSFLARRWRYIWTSLAILNFNFYLCQSAFKDSDAFTAFVNWVLRVRDSNTCIRRFNLNWCSSEYRRDVDVTGRVNEWVLGALRGNVQELSLDVSLWSYQMYKFPPCLFSCRSLTKLVLVLGCSLISEIILPDSIDLPMLKSLKLYGFAIYNEKSTAKLFASCPVLESLSIRRCNVNLNDVYAPSLKCLKLKYNDYSTEGGSTIRLYAPNLTSFICRNYMLLDYDIENLSSLVRADILMMVEDEEEDFDVYSELSAWKKESCALCMMNFLRSLQNVKYLALSPLVLEVVSEVPDLLDSQQDCQFYNLRNLELQTFLSRHCFRAIIYLFKISPNIESLSVMIDKECSENPRTYPFCDEMGYDPQSVVDDWQEGLSLPCLLDHLKFVHITGIRGCINELNFLKILLENAMVLKEVVLYCDWSDPGPGDMQGRMIHFFQTLIKIPAASSSITFAYF